MSELLNEANRLEDEALNDFYMSYKMSFGDGYFQGIEVMRKLIEKHEKPKGLSAYVHPPYHGLPLEYSTNFWALKYRILSYVEEGESIIEAREAIEREFSKFHFAELNIELTEKQKEKIMSAF